MADHGTDGSMSGLSESEAKGFHSLFMASTIAYVVIAVIAHFLVWQWRPWFPGIEGYASLVDGVQTVANHVVTRLT